MPQSATKPRLPRRAVYSPTLREHFGDLLFVSATILVLMFLRWCGLDIISGRIVLVSMIVHRCSGNPAFKSAAVAVASLIKTLKS
jgi:hypothetical protein